VPHSPPIRARRIGLSQLDFFILRQEYNLIVIVSNMKNFLSYGEVLMPIQQNSEFQKSGRFLKKAAQKLF
jgi:hypothetical protein